MCNGESRTPQASAAPSLLCAIVARGAMGYEVFRGRKQRCKNLHSVVLLSQPEIQALRRLQARHTKLIFTGINNSGIPDSKNTVLLTPDPAKPYFETLRKNFATGSKTMPVELLDQLPNKDPIELEAPPTVAANFGMVNGTPHIFLFNFGGLVPHKVAAPTPATGIRVRIRSNIGSTTVYLPFLGEERILHGVKHRNRLEFTLPSIECGAVIWVQK